MDCIEAVHQLYHYLDGELTDERRREIAVHLDACASCGSAAEFEAELRAVIANRCRDRVPESLRARIAGAIHEEALHPGEGQHPGEGAGRDAGEGRHQGKPSGRGTGGPTGRGTAP